MAQSEIHGRGVFTFDHIPEGALLEICPVIIIPESEVDTIHDTVLHDYYYYWGEDEKEACIVLGFGSIFNHSSSPNAQCVPDYEGRTFNYYALRDIRPGEEIKVNYNGDEGKGSLWFEERK